MSEPSINEVMSIIETLSKKPVVDLNKDEVAVLQKLAQRIISLNPEEQKAVHQILTKAGVLGDLVRVFEILIGIISAATFVRNLAWLVFPIMLVLATINGWLSTATQYFQWPKL